MSPEEIAQIVEAGIIFQKDVLHNIMNCVLFGLYLLTVLIAIRVFISKIKLRHSQTALFTIAALSTTTAHLVAENAEELLLIKYGIIRRLPGGLDAQTASADKTVFWWRIVDVWASTICVFAWRAWVIWDRDKHTPRVLAALMVANVGCALNSSMRTDETGPASTLAWVSNALSLVVNALSTGLIGISAWQHYQLLKSATRGGRTHVQKMLLLLTESGAIFCVIQLLYVILQVQDVNAPSPRSLVTYFFNVIAAILTIFSALYPVCVFVILRTGYSTVENFSLPDITVTPVYSDVAHLDIIPVVQDICSSHQVLEMCGNLSPGERSTFSDLWLASRKPVGYGAKFLDSKVTLKFYTEVRMIILNVFRSSNRRFYQLTIASEKDIGDFTLYFLAFDQGQNYKSVLELMHNHGTESDASFAGYSSGNSEPGKGFGHIAITVENLEVACARFEKLGVPFMKKRPQDGKIRNIAFILDPDGCIIQFLASSNKCQFLASSIIQFLASISDLEDKIYSHDRVETWLYQICRTCEKLDDPTCEKLTLTQTCEKLYDPTCEKMTIFTIVPQLRCVWWSIDCPWNLIRRSSSSDKGGSYSHAFEFLLIKSLMSPEEIAQIVETGIIFQKAVLQITMNCVLYGLYVLTVFITIRIFISKIKLRHSHMALFTIAALSTTTAHLVAQNAEELLLIKYGIIRRLPGGLEAQAASANNTVFLWEIVDVWASIISVFAWRAWVIWDRDKHTPRVLAALMVANVGCALDSSVRTDETGTASTLAWVSNALSLIVNASSTGLIGISTWAHYRLLGSAGRGAQTHVQKMLLLLTESGAIFCVIQLLYVILQVQDVKALSPGSLVTYFYDALSAILTIFSALYPVCVFVILRTGHSTVESFSLSDITATPLYSDVAHLDIIPVVQDMY
ncbi:hypothetical protein BDP27DRAFT_1405916 [Rhodocollybia butyracea]|uniref:VOC domain-containing protein n=1 Tax=Rhodocollybia butyracea TaxID=206335 RepID=A0A9P5U121_9AGAR|nr:hypothetical protein BDP27DRAFT_1405916 [Rhodocollybia butyracea]